jgi:AraC-like DNA-binding protein
MSGTASSGEHDEAWLWRLKSLDDLAVLSAQYVAQVFPRHTHETFSIGVNENATTAFFCRGSLRIAPAGTITIVNPGEVHTGQAIDHNTWTYRCFYPSCALLERVASNVFGGASGPPFFLDPVVDDPELACLLVEVHRRIEAEPQVTDRDCGLIDAFGQLVARHAQPSGPRPPVQTERPAVRCAREYIEVNYKRNVSLASLAEAVGISRFHLLRVFRLETGLTPGEYQTQVRIEQAKQLLAQGIRISFVASEVGFADQSHLTRRFKRWVGVTPGHYLRYHAADQERPTCTS